MLEPFTNFKSLAPILSAGSLILEICIVLFGDWKQGSDLWNLEGLTNCSTTNRMSHYYSLFLSSR